MNRFKNGTQFPAENQRNCSKKKKKQQEEEFKQI